MQYTQKKLELVTANVLTWLRSELQEIAIQFGDGNALRMEVREAVVPTNDNAIRIQTSDRTGYDSIAGWELSLEEAGDGFTRRHRLLILVCREWEIVLRANIGNLDGDVPEPIEPHGDPRLALLPMYRQTVSHEAPRLSRTLRWR